jgi:hypothetical protein
MQCILYKIDFWKGFSYVLQIDMHLLCTPRLAKFYSCKKWVLQQEIQKLRDQLRDSDATVRAYQRMVAGEASDLYASDTCTWSATSSGPGAKDSQK